VVVSCNSLAPDRLLSELFGHTRGALPGAEGARRGLFVEADGGTLFLDEIGDMPAELQAKLLRVLEDGEVRAVGSDTVRRVDVRVVAATNQRLPVDTGRFRQDLFFRLNVLRVAVPPLRERREDVPALVEHFLARSRARYPGARARRFTPEALRHLQAHAWPGNVRELENLVEQVVLLTPGEDVGLEALDPGIAGVGPSPLERAKEEIVPLRELEARYVAWAIDRCGGDEARAAERLGLDELSLRRLRRDRERERDETP
jgi:two-component system response regulator HydG